LRSGFTLARKRAVQSGLIPDDKPAPCFQVRAHNEMSRNWVPTEGWSAAADNLLPICMGDLTAYLLGDIITNQSVWGYKGEGTAHPLHIGCSRVNVVSETETDADGPQLVCDCRAGHHISNFTNQRPGTPWQTMKAISANGIERLRTIMARTVEEKLPLAQKLGSEFPQGSKITDLPMPQPIGTDGAEAPPADRA